MKNRMQAITLSALISIPAIVIAAPVQTAQGVGVIKAIDAKSQSVTLAHDAIPALKWAGMTMPFKLAKPVQGTVLKSMFKSPTWKALGKKLAVDTAQIMGGEVAPVMVAAICSVVMPAAINAYPVAESSAMTRP